ncbi:efflux RND transporter periplasmic adaptor subunit [Shumkonia mesophila]|uniref:efflux RND transporter periplasmic adaptor subunit n=1 Tax=Shumkonia mesophila TaxID=2838854 RepID=UPI0029352A0F|nr:efflux RND transporter periplasmic adaptor subunit [Shumkonia mesophila]
MTISATHASLLAAFFSLSLAACDSQTQASAPAQQPRPVEVSVVTLEKQAVPITVELPGRTSAFRISEVRPQVTGIVKKRLFEEGSVVAAGQTLYQIDAAPYEASLASARAEAQRAEATLVAARSKAERYNKLVTVDAVSRQNHDDAIAALKQGEAQVAAAKAAVEAAAINLAYTNVKSPISGRIGKSAITEGALVTANQAAALAVVQQLDPIYVDVTEAAADLLRMRRDIAEGRLTATADHAPVTLLIGDEIYQRTGTLKFSDVTVDQGTGTVQLRAVFPNQDGVLLPGLFVKARIEQGVRQDAIVVPQRAVSRSTDGKPLVWVVGADDTVSPRPVEIERILENDWLISAGLEDGERVVVEGFQKIRPGSHVTAVPMTPKVAAGSAAEASRSR